MPWRQCHGHGIRPSQSLPAFDNGHAPFIRNFERDRKAGGLVREAAGVFGPFGEQRRAFAIIVEADLFGFRRIGRAGRSRHGRAAAATSGGS